MIIDNPFSPKEIHSSIDKRAKQRLAKPAKESLTMRHKPTMLHTYSHYTHSFQRQAFLYFSLYNKIQNHNTKIRSKNASPNHKLVPSFDLLRFLLLKRQNLKKKYQEKKKKKKGT